MFLEWNKFKGWNILEYFLNGNSQTHIKGIARELRISSFTAQHYLALYEKEGVLEKEKIANTLSYRLKETSMTTELKKTYFISRLSGFIDSFRKENPLVSVLVLYGSHAKGTFDKKSDIDLLVISQEKKMNEKSIHALEKKTGKEAKAQVFSVTEWNRLKEKKDMFALSVKENNIILFGDGI
jgi:uncharacterized protein